jgi:hypothetical protein
MENNKKVEPKKEEDLKVEAQRVKKIRTGVRGGWAACSKAN